MCEMFVKFPEVLLIDATHGTNVSKYKVFSFMAHGVFGKGQYVQHAILQNERSETLQTAIETFKTNNPEWKRVQCVIIDKDFTEMKVLRASMPQARILLCQFHVIKWLWEEIAADCYRFTPWQTDRLRSVVKLLVYTKTQREYEAQREYMRHLLKLAPGRDCDATNSTDRDADAVCTATNQAMEAEYSNFEPYFVKNWDSCRDQWCSYTRQSAITLGNNTNNRLEALWKHLKETVDAFMTVDECIACIMYYQSMLEKDYEARLYKLSVVRNAAYDTEMDRVLNLVGEHVCNLIYEEYIFAVKSAKYQFYEGVAKIYFIKNVSTDEDSRDEPNVEYSVDQSSWTCSCMFMATRLLPCRHVFYIRKSIGAESVIPTHLLNPRWLLSAARAPDTVDIPSVVPYEEGPVLPHQKTPWDKNHKFRAANEIATRICQAMCEYGMKEFQDALSALTDVESVFTKRCHEDLVRALKSIGSTSDASVEFISQQTQSANPEAEFVDSQTEEGEHKARDHGCSPTNDMVGDMLSENARATVFRDGDDPQPAGTARPTSERKVSSWRM